MFSALSDIASFGKQKNLQKDFNFVVQSEKPTSLHLQNLTCWTSSFSKTEKHKKNFDGVLLFLVLSFFLFLFLFFVFLILLLFFEILPTVVTVARLFFNVRATKKVKR